MISRERKALWGHALHHVSPAYASSSTVTCRSWLLFRIQGVKKRSYCKKDLLKGVAYDYLLVRFSRCHCSSGVEQRIRNAWVVGSIPTSGSIFMGGACRGGNRRIHASLAQLVEQLTLNQFVHGSSPWRGTIRLFLQGTPSFLCLVSSVGRAADS